MVEFHQSIPDPVMTMTMTLSRGGKKVAICFRATSHSIPTLSREYIHFHLQICFVVIQLHTFGILGSDVLDVPLPSVSLFWSSLSNKPSSHKSSGIRTILLRQQSFVVRSSSNDLLPQKKISSYSIMEAYHPKPSSKSLTK